MRYDVFIDLVIVDCLVLGSLGPWIGCKFMCSWINSHALRIYQGQEHSPPEQNLCDGQVKSFLTTRTASSTDPTTCDLEDQ